MLHLIEIDRWGEHGWTWTLADPETGYPVSVHRTNWRGQGLFRRLWGDAAWEQTHGHMQYTAPASREGLVRFITGSGDVVDQTG